MIKGDTLYTNSGFTIVKDQSLKIGECTMTDGDFKYIGINSAPPVQQLFFNRLSGACQPGQRLAQVKVQFLMKIVKLQKRGKGKNGFAYYILLSAFPRYGIDVETPSSLAKLPCPTSSNPTRNNQSNT
jgi:hypothetical protein